MRDDFSQQNSAHERKIALPTPLNSFEIKTSNNPSIQNRPLPSDFFNDGAQIISRSSPVIFAINRKFQQIELINPEVYSVREEDSWDSIAKNFSITKEVLAIFNNKTIKDELTIDQKLLIPPKEVEKIYTVRRGDTLLRIAKSYGVPLDSLAFINRKALNDIVVIGEKILIPPGGDYRYFVNVYQTISKFVEAVSAKATLDGFFITPVSGTNFGIPHSKNAIDIAAACGSPVYAAASGIFLSVSNVDAWNGGLGNYIKIQHFDGSTATYAHLSSVNKSVRYGISVDQGNLIGFVGNTGQVIGPNGCHLHFEVLGRSNPLITVPVDETDGNE